MSSSGSGEQRAAPAEQHLGDRLAAFVDGELGDDTRDRVLAHLVTCPQCKAAASEQRRLKSVVAASEQPMLSAGLLARLQGLPGLPPTGDGTEDADRTRDWRDRDDEGHGPGAAGGRDQERRGPFDGGLLGSGVFGGGGSRRREEFSYLTPGRDLVPGGSGGRGFRIHELTRAAAADGRPEDREQPEVPAHSGSGTAASRGRRFAFAAAGAFSMAAIALGSALPMEAAVDGGARPDDGPAVSPLSANSVPDTRGVTPRGVLDAGDRRMLRAPAAVTSVTPVSVTRPLMAPGALPLVTPAASPVSPGPQVPAIRR
ncbi:zf-HC2 domain-containing protein [Streptomyces sp. NPDC093221]|uniref:zf-HC2 domain-containing protein n=1 Tax=Streptomyces sp. NPDC093221 TaxID=3366032 RepID=UPI0038150074